MFVSRGDTIQKVIYTSETVSITVTCELGIPIDLNEVANKIKEFDYMPDLFFQCGYLRDPNLKGNARIWKSGTIHIIGKSQKQVEQDLDYILSKLKDKMNLIISKPIRID